MFLCLLDQHRSADICEQVHRADRDERRGILHPLEKSQPTNPGTAPYLGKTISSAQPPNYMVSIPYPPRLTLTLST